MIVTFGGRAGRYTTAGTIHGGFTSTARPVMREKCSNDKQQYNYRYQTTQVAALTIWWHTLTIPNSFLSPLNYIHFRPFLDVKWYSWRTNGHYSVLEAGYKKECCANLLEFSHHKQEYLLPQAGFNNFKLCVNINLHLLRQHYLPERSMFISNNFPTFNSSHTKMEAL